MGAAVYARVRHVSFDRAARRSLERFHSTYPYEKNATKNSMVASHSITRNCASLP